MNIIYFLMNNLKELDYYISKIKEIEKHKLLNNLNYINKIEETEKLKKLLDNFFIIFLNE